jgi:hypothetical protein
MYEIKNKLNSYRILRWHKKSSPWVLRISHGFLAVDQTLVDV